MRESGESAGPCGDAEDGARLISPRGPGATRRRSPRSRQAASHRCAWRSRGECSLPSGPPSTGSWAGGPATSIVCSMSVTQQSSSRCPGASGSGAGSRFPKRPTRSTVSEDRSTSLPDSPRGERSRCSRSRPTSPESRRRSDGTTRKLVWLRAWRRGGSVGGRSWSPGSWSCPRTPPCGGSLRGIRRHSARRIRTRVATPGRGCGRQPVQWRQSGSSRLSLVEVINENWAVPGGYGDREATELVVSRRRTRPDDRHLGGPRLVYECSRACLPERRAQCGHTKPSGLAGRDTGATRGCGRGLRRLPRCRRGPDGDGDAELVTPLPARGTRRRRRGGRRTARRWWRRPPRRR
jgi:hypothetical protein